VSDPYCYPGTDLLRNTAGVTDAGELQHLEFQRSLLRLIELAERPLPGRYYLQHLQAFHRHIFQDVYPWAGEVRTVDLGRSGSSTSPGPSTSEGRPKTSSPSWPAGAISKAWTTQVSWLPPRSSSGTSTRSIRSGKATDGRSAPS